MESKDGQDGGNDYFRGSCLYVKTLNKADLPEVELFVNGESIGKKTAPDHFFYFDVKNEGESVIVARAGNFTDEGKIRKVETFNEEYRLKEHGAVLNWFDIDAPEGRFSLNDKISDILSSSEGKLWFASLGMKIKKQMDQNKKGGEKKKAGGFEVDLKADGGLMQMMGGFTVLRLTSMMGMMNISFTKEELLEMNKQLNKTKKPKKYNIIKTEKDSPQFSGTVLFQPKTKTYIFYIHH